jgi:hypothetical protein
VEHAAALVLALALKLLAVVGDAIGMVEGAARHILEHAGVTGPAETVVLVVLGLLLVVAAFQVFGRLFLVLLLIFLALVLLRAFLPHVASHVS